DLFIFSVSHRIPPYMVFLFRSLMLTPCLCLVVDVPARSGVPLKSRLVLSICSTLPRRVPAVSHRLIRCPGPGSGWESRWWEVRRPDALESLSPSLFLRWDA